MHQVWILQVHELTNHDFSGNRFALRVWPKLNLIKKFNVIVILLKCVDVTNPHPLTNISKYVKILECQGWLYSQMQCEIYDKLAKRNSQCFPP